MDVMVDNIGGLDKLRRIRPNAASKALRSYFLAWAAFGFGAPTLNATFAHFGLTRGNFYPMVSPDVPYSKTKPEEAPIIDPSQIIPPPKISSLPDVNPRPKNGIPALADSKTNRTGHHRIGQSFAMAPIVPHIDCKKKKCEVASALVFSKYPTVEETERYSIVRSETFESNPKIRLSP